MDSQFIGHGLHFSSLALEEILLSEGSHWGGSTNPFVSSVASVSRNDKSRLVETEISGMTLGMILLPTV